MPKMIVTGYHELSSLFLFFWQAAYVEESKAKSAMPKMIVTGYHELNMIHFFTAGEKEVRGRGVITYVWAGHVNESCSTYVWVMSHV